MLAVICFSMVPLACGHSILYTPRARNWVAAQGQECQGGKSAQKSKECPIPEEEYGCNLKSEKSPGCTENDPQSLNAWGVKDRAKGTWPSPVGSYGLCGDPVQLRDWVPISEMPYMVPTDPQAVYTAGEIVEFEVGVYAEHHGHYEFRICDKTLDGSLKSAQEGQDCLNKWVLKRAPPSGSGQDSQPIDTRHPGRWHVGASASKLHINFMNSSTVVAGEDWDDNDIINIKAGPGETDPRGATSVYKMRYIIPEGLECERCTLQYYWPTANTCTLDDDVAKYWEDLGREPPTYWPGKHKCVGTQHGEEFWNCADITVKNKNGGPSPSPDRRRKNGGPSPPSDRRRQTPPRRRTAERRRRRRSSERRRRRRSSGRRRKSSTRRRKRRRR